MDSTTNPGSAGQETTRSGFLPGRIVHLHPTATCNLACLHCYSESDPGRTSALDPEPLEWALNLLRAEGYTSISVSGGEPLVYKPLRRIVEHAKSLGFHVTMISNGLLVNDNRRTLLSLFDRIAISFDGMSSTHNRIRARRNAFERASAALKWLADTGMPVAAAISLTRDAIPELPDLADHLVRQGADALQVRPVARAGRAVTLDDSLFYGAADRARLYLVVLALQQEMPENVRIHCDLAPAQGLWKQRGDYSSLLGQCATKPGSEVPLADLVNPLVITDQGVLKPVAYDFDERFDMAKLDGLVPEDLIRYRRSGLEHFRNLMGGALASLQHSRELVDWFDYCTRLSQRDQRDNTVDERQSAVTINVVGE